MDKPVFNSILHLPTVCFFGAQYKKCNLIDPKRDRKTQWRVPSVNY